MGLVLSLLYLLLNIAFVVLCAALIWWALRWFNVSLDPMVFKVCQFILAVIVLILIVSWFAGVLPPRGIFGYVALPAPVVPVPRARPATQ